MADDEVPEAFKEAFSGDVVDPPQTRGRQKKEAAFVSQPQQADMADIVLEDAQLEVWLEELLDNAEAAQKYREAGKGVKTRMLEDHHEACNSDDDGVHSGYVRVGRFRFRPRYGTREAVTREVTYGAGKDWEPLEIERIV